MQLSRNRSFITLALVGIAACGLHLGIILISGYFWVQHETINRDFFLTIGRALDQQFFAPNFIMVVAAVTFFNRYKDSRVAIIPVTAGSIMMGILNVIKIQTSVLALFYLFFWMALPYTLLRKWKQPNQAL